MRLATFSFGTKVNLHEDANNRIEAAKAGSCYIGNESLARGHMTFLSFSALEYSDRDTWGNLLQIKLIILNFICSISFVCLIENA